MTCNSLFLERTSHHFSFTHFFPKDMTVEVRMIYDSGWGQGEIGKIDDLGLIY